MKNKKWKKQVISLQIIISLVISLLSGNIIFQQNTINAAEKFIRDNMGDKFVISSSTEIITNGAINITRTPTMIATSSGLVKDIYLSFAGGDGTQEHPYQIATTDQMTAFLKTIYSNDSTYNRKYYQLISDISMKGVKISYNEAYAFQGEFDGQGYSISNLEASALFPHTKGAVIKNLILKSATISGKEYIGGIVGWGEGRLTIQHCMIDEASTVQGETTQEKENINSVYIGGICGYAELAEISFCTSSAICQKEEDIREGLYGEQSYGIHTSVKMGGIAGQCKKIAQCQNYGTIQMKSITGKEVSIDSYEMGLGGIAGCADIICNSDNYGNIDIKANSTYLFLRDIKVRDIVAVGGIVGIGLDEITNSHNMGNINIIVKENRSAMNKDDCYPESVGGIAGCALYSRIHGCSNTGIIISDFYATGGIIGLFFGNEMEQCSNGGSIIGKNYVGGIIGRIYDGSQISGMNASDINYGIYEYTRRIYGDSKIFTCENRGEVKGTLYIGGIVGDSGTAFLEKCTNKANIILIQSEQIAYVGGIAGKGEQISFCENEGMISEERDGQKVIEKNCIGGIAGTGMVYASTNRGNIVAVSGKGVGGIIGTGSAITSVNMGSVEGISEIGGIAGVSEFMYRCYNMGTVIGKENVGGLSGIANNNFIQSYTCGKIEGTESAKNIGAAVGSAKEFNGVNSFYLKQNSLEAVGNGYHCEGLTGKSADELKSEDIGNLLNEDIKIEVSCFSKWSMDETKNQGYPILWTTGLVHNDTCYRKIEVYSEYPIYYTYLPLRTTSYIVSENELKDAVMKDGYYYIDYSDCKITKSYCLAVTNEKKDYNVDGFDIEHDLRGVLVKYNEWSDIERYRYEKTEKIYECKGSDFYCLFDLKAYPAKYVSKVSNMKWDYNWDDDSDAAGTDLISQISYNSFGLFMKYKIRNGEDYRITTSKRKTTKISPSYVTRFLWKESGEEIWREQSELTEKMLKEYAKAGTVLKMRFLLECTLYLAMEDESDIEENVYGNFYGNEVTVKLPKKQKRAPKIKVDFVKMTIGIKNGMQYSYDQKQWNTVFPYTKSIYYYEKGYYEGYREGSNVNCSGYTSKKISSIPLSYFDAMQDTIYVRNIGFNILPSEPCKVTLPVKRSLGPTVQFENKSTDKFVVSDITQADDDLASNVKYEYCIIDQDLSVYVEKKGINIKWKELKNKTNIDQRSKTIYSWSDILEEFNEEDPNGTYNDEERKERWEDFVDFGGYSPMKKRIKNKKTCWLGYIEFKRAKEKIEKDNGASYVVVRRKGNKSLELPASYSSYYYYDKKQNELVLITQHGEY